MPKITDDDDVNLDDIDTNPPEENDSGGADEVNENDLPEGDQPDDVEDQPDAERDQDDEDEQDRRLAARDRTPAEPEVRQVRRGRENDRIRSLNDDLRRSQEETRALQRRFDEFMQRSQQSQPRGESEQERTSRRALLTPEERMAEDIHDSEQRTLRTVQQQTFAMQDATDKSSYDAKASTTPLYSRWRDRVETERSRLLQNGANVGRRAVLAYLIGDKALQQAESGKPSSQRAQGHRRVERQTVRPGNSRNDMQPSDRRGRGKSLEERLANQPL